MRRFAPLLFPVLPLVLFACRGSSSSDAAPAASTPRASTASTSTTTTTAAELGDPNALVPPALTGKLRFEMAKVPSRGSKEPGYDVYRPAGWQDMASSGYNGLYRSGDKRQQLDSSWATDRTAVPARWEPTIAKTQFSTDGVLKVLHEKKDRGSWLRAVEKDKGVTVTYARWKDGEPLYWRCEVTLESEYRDAWRAFEAACAAPQGH
jgi:hypothetical protein